MKKIRGAATTGTHTTRPPCHARALTYRMHARSVPLLWMIAAGPRTCAADSRQYVWAAVAATLASPASAAAAAKLPSFAFLEGDVDAVRNRTRAKRDLEKAQVREERIRAKAQREADREQRAEQTRLAKEAERNRTRIERQKVREARELERAAEIAKLELEREADKRKRKDSEKQAHKLLRCQSRDPKWHGPCRDWCTAITDQPWSVKCTWQDNCCGCAPCLDALGNATTTTTTSVVAPRRAPRRGGGGIARDGPSRRSAAQKASAKARRRAASSGGVGDDTSNALRPAARWSRTRSNHTRRSADVSIHGLRGSIRRMNRTRHFTTAVVSAGPGPFGPTATLAKRRGRRGTSRRRADSHSQDAGTMSGRLLAQPPAPSAEIATRWRAPSASVESNLVSKSPSSSPPTNWGARLIGPARTLSPEEAAINHVVTVSAAFLVVLVGCLIGRLRVWTVRAARSTQSEQRAGHGRLIAKSCRTPSIPRPRHDSSVYLSV